MTSTVTGLAQAPTPGGSYSPRRENGPSQAGPLLGDTAAAATSSPGGCVSLSARLISVSYLARLTGGEKPSLGKRSQAEPLALSRGPAARQGFPTDVCARGELERLQGRSEEAGLAKG